MRGCLGLDALLQLQNPDLWRPQFRSFFHLPRQLRRAIPDSAARMRAYIAKLNAAVERDRSQRAEKERAATQAARERLTPL
jgi:hypothetical protein